MDRWAEKCSIGADFEVIENTCAEHRKGTGGTGNYRKEGI